MRDLPEQLEEFTDNLEDAEVPALANTSYDSEGPTKVATRNQYLYSRPGRPKLRNLQANQDYEGALQEAHWRSSTSGRQFR